MLVTSEAGELVLLKTDSSKMMEVARFQAIDGKTWNHPVLVGVHLYVRNADAPEDQGPFDFDRMLAYASEYVSRDADAQQFESHPLRAAVHEAVEFLRGKKVDEQPRMLFMILLQRCIDRNPETPWAYLAAREMANALGVEATQTALTPSALAPVGPAPN